MKQLFFAFVLLISGWSYGQAFHFTLLERTLIKTVDQSPAHWYLEIYNDVSVDTTLRWKTYFMNIPAAWDINFDDQNFNYLFVQDGDSSDFICYGMPAFPQKLIIGAEFNGTIGEGSTFFDIYDPDNPSYVVTIRFKFIVTPSTADIGEFSADPFITQKGNTFEFGETLLDKPIQLHAANGQLIFDGKITPEMQFDAVNGMGSYILSIGLDEGKYTRTVYLR